MKVSIKEVTREYKGFFTLEKAKLQFEKFDGTASPEIVRENFYRGDSVAALVYDSKNENVLLVRQFRYPVYAVEPENAWIVELVAGSLQKREKPEQTMLRELKEEVHLRVNKEDLHFISQFYVSPGGTSERIYLYGVDVDLSKKSAKYGGLDYEQEDIEKIVLPFKDVINKLEQNQINDAKTIIALLWLKDKYPHLF